MQKYKKFLFYNIYDSYFHPARPTTHPSPWRHPTIKCGLSLLLYAQSGPAYPSRTEGGESAGSPDFAYVIDGPVVSPERDQRLSRRGHDIGLRREIAEGIPYSHRLGDFF